MKTHQKRFFFFVLIDHTWIKEENKNAETDLFQLLSCIDHTSRYGLHTLCIEYQRTDSLQDRMVSKKTKSLLEDVEHFFTDPLGLYDYADDDEKDDEKDDEEVETEIDRAIRLNTQQADTHKVFKGDLLYVHFVSNKNLYHALCKKIQEFYQEDLYTFVSFVISFETFAHFQKILMEKKPRKKPYIFKKGKTQVILRPSTSSTTISKN